MLALAITGTTRAGTTLRTQLAPLLERHGFDCHSGDAAEAGLNLRTLTTTGHAPAQLRVHDEPCLQAAVTSTSFSFDPD